MKKTLLLLLLASAVLPLAGQTLTRTVNATLGGFSGTMTYGYRLDGGREILEGKKSFTARSGENTYQLEANYRDGQLDGAASARLHRTYMSSGREAGALKVWKAALDVTLAARFHEGQLNGQLTCDYTPSGRADKFLTHPDKASFSASYEEGIVKGNYSYIDYLYDCKVVANGSTDADGYMDGKWQYLNPWVDEYMVLTYQKGIESSGVTSSAMRNYLAGRLDEKELFDSYGYRLFDGTEPFPLAAQFFDRIAGVLGGMEKVIPFEFGCIHDGLGEEIPPVQPLHALRTRYYRADPAFTATGFEDFKTAYFESLCGKPLSGLIPSLDGDNPSVEIRTEAFPAWRSRLRNLQDTDVYSGHSVVVGLSKYQLEDLRDDAALDAVRRRFARSAEALLPVDSPYKTLFTEGKMPGDFVAKERGAENIARVCSDIKTYTASVKSALSGLPRTEDGKYFIKDDVYYSNPGWDVNLVAADAERMLSSCKEAGRLYEEGLAYASARPDVAASFKSLCSKIETGNYAEMVGAVSDARAFSERIVGPDVLGKIGTDAEMRQALTASSYAHMHAVYPEAPKASFRDVAGMDSFARESLEYASFQRNLMTFDARVKEITAEKALLDAELTGRTYKAAASAINEKYAQYTLKPSFRDETGFVQESGTLGSCLDMVRDARAYVAAHKEYTRESEDLRDLLSRSKTGHISKFYRNLTKGVDVSWDHSAPVGTCTGRVREALDATRRIRAVVSAPDAAARDKAIKSESDPYRVWQILEAQ